MSIGVGARYDAVVVGGGHNGLVAAAYLAKAGRSVLVLERQRAVGGLAISEEVFPGVPARLSRYSYLVGLLPGRVVTDLGLDLRLLRRRVSSYTPVERAGRPAGLLVSDDERRTAASFAAVTGGPGEHQAWRRFRALTGELARRVFPTLLQPLPSRAGLRALVGERAWDALFERPLAAVLESTFADETVRGTVLTDGLIGTFADPGHPGRLANRCFLHHVIGRGTGEWLVPVGGMGAVSAALAAAARAAGAEIRTGAEVVAVEPDGEVSVREGDLQYVVAGRHVLANVAPATLAGLLGEPPSLPAPEGAQVKVNLLLARLPRLRQPGIDPREAFAGTFHVNEDYDQLARAHREATQGRVPALPPCEAYCHSLTDPSVLAPSLQAAGAQTMTLFGLHLPARLFRADPEGAREEALRALLRSLDSVLAEPVEDCLWRTPEGAPCVEAVTPVDLEGEVGLPGGHIFHADLSWPYAEDEADAGRWGVETAYERVLLCGAGARRGGGVSGIPGHNAARAVLVASR